MPTHSSPIARKQQISASRKAVIYFGTAISAVGAIISFSGFFALGAGFIELTKTEADPGMFRLIPNQSFEEFDRQTDEWWNQNVEARRREKQIFSQIVTAVVPRVVGGAVLITLGNTITVVGKKGITRLTEEESKEHNVGFYVERYFNEGGTMSENHSTNINATSGSNVVYAGSDISGTVTTTINQLQQAHESNAIQLMELLRQLQHVIEAESALNIEDKADALEQVKVLAEAGQKPRESTMQKGSRNAIKILRGTAAALPPAAEMLKACNTLLPTIAKLLGLGL